MNITGENYRGVKSRKLVSKKKDAYKSSPSAPPVTNSRCAPTQTQAVLNWEILRNNISKCQKGEQTCQDPNQHSVLANHDVPLRQDADRLESERDDTDAGLERQCQTELVWRAAK